MNIYTVAVQAHKPREQRIESEALAVAAESESDACQLGIEHTLKRTFLRRDGWTGHRAAAERVPHEWVIRAAQGDL